MTSDPFEPPSSTQATQPTEFKLTAKKSDEYRTFQQPNLLEHGWRFIRGLGGLVFSSSPNIQTSSSATQPDTRSDMPLFILIIYFLTCAFTHFFAFRFSKRQQQNRKHSFDANPAEATSSQELPEPASVIDDTFESSNNKDELLKLIVDAITTQLNIDFVKFDRQSVAIREGLSPNCYQLKQTGTAEDLHRLANRMFDFSKDCDNLYLDVALEDGYKDLRKNWREVLRSKETQRRMDGLRAEFDEILLKLDSIVIDRAGFPFDRFFPKESQRAGWSYRLRCL